MNSPLKPDAGVLRLIPGEFAKRHLVLPLRRAGRSLTVAMADPADTALVEDLHFLTQFEIEAVAVGEPKLLQLIDENYGAASEPRDKPRENGAGAARTAVDDEPAVRLINDIFTDAVRRGASDIHVEPYEGELRVRYRLDGILREMMRAPRPPSRRPSHRG